MAEVRDEKNGYGQEVSEIRFTSPGQRLPCRDRFLLMTRRDLIYWMPLDADIISKSRWDSMSAFAISTFSSKVRANGDKGPILRLTGRGAAYLNVFQSAV
ncbi:MAG: hypothetical protein ACR2PF_16550 [Rhizobiaceae bacterium]